MIKSIIKKIKSSRSEKIYKRECEEEEKKFQLKKDEADHKYKITGRIHYVIPLGDEELQVVDNLWLKAYNAYAKKEKLKTIPMFKMRNSAYYTSKK